MRRDLLNKTRGTMIVAVLSLITAGACMAQESKGGGRLVGTWDAEVRLKDCATGNVQPSFKSIASFNQGGTTIGSTSSQPQARRTPEHGIWRHVTGNTYEFKFKSFNFDSMGVAVGYVIVQHTIELDSSGDSYFSDGTAKFFTLNGTPTGSGCSEADGTRMTF